MHYRGSDDLPNVAAMAKVIFLPFPPLPRKPVQPPSPVPEALLEYMAPPRPAPNVIALPLRSPVAQPGEPADVLR